MDQFSKNFCEQLSSVSRAGDVFKEKGKRKKVLLVTFFLFLLPYVR